MKRYFFCILIFVAITNERCFGVDTNAYEWGPITADAQMSISLKSGGKEIKTNQQIVLLVYLRNLSTKGNIHFFRQLASVVYAPEVSFVVVSPSGKELLPITQGGPVHGSAQIVQIPPQHSFKYEFDLSQVYNFNELGVYKIIAKRALESSASNHGFTVESNPLYLTVVPSE